jgi:glycosyltransferase involved in cell wall biosynthesis
MNTIGMVSRIEKGKGQDVFIDSIFILKKKYKDINGLIIGEGDDWELKQKIKKLNLEKNIKLLGFVTDNNLEKILAKFEVFVFPTYWPLEGFGLVLLEAMEKGIPIVTTNFGPIPEVVGDAAILVAPNNANALAEGIDKILRNKKLANSLVLKGLSRVKQFNIKKITNLYFNNFLETVKSNS